MEKGTLINPYKENINVPFTFIIAFALAE